MLVNGSVISVKISYRGHGNYLEGEGEGESSNHYRDFIPAKRIIRWL
jgi:hypothetical protein